MTSFILNLKGGGTRSFTREQLGTILLNLKTAGNFYSITDGIEFYKIGLGRLLINQIQGNYANLRIDEQFNPTWDPGFTPRVRFTRKNTSDFFNLDGALAAEGFQGLVGSSLDSLYLLLYESVPAKSRYTTVDDSQDQIVLKQNRNFIRNISDKFADYSVDDYHLYRIIKQYITNNYQAGITLDGLPCVAIELAGVYKVSTGVNTFHIGPTALRPTITLVGNATVGVQVGDSWTEAANGGVSAQDFDGNALTVVTTGTVDTSILGISTLTYTAVSSQGDIAEVKQRFIVATDTTSPVLTLSGGHLALTVGDTWSGELGYSAIDNLDGDLTNQVQMTGWAGSTTTAGQLTRTYTVTDSQSNTASTFRTVTIAVPYIFEAAGPWTSPQWYATGLGTTMTSETDLMSLGTGNGYEIKVSYKRSSDPQGFIFAITDSSSSDTYCETPSSTAAVAFRIDASAGVKVRFPQSHPSWGSAKYFGDSGGVSGHDQTVFKEVTLRVWDKDSSNWGMFLQCGTNTYTRNMAKSGSGSLFIPGTTSTWTGYAVNCVETGLQVTTSQGWKVTPGGEVKDISISALNSSADHTQP